jgi:hypothetical protein
MVEKQVVGMFLTPSEQSSNLAIGNRKDIRLNVMQDRNLTKHTFSNPIIIFPTSDDVYRLRYKWARIV